MPAFLLPGSSETNEDRSKTKSSRVEGLLEEEEEEEEEEEQEGSEEEGEFEENFGGIRIFELSWSVMGV